MSRASTPRDTLLMTMFMPPRGKPQPMTSATVATRAESRAREVAWTRPTLETRPDHEGAK